MTPNSDGPDISHHNPVADWDAIPQFRLFIAKATEGRTFRSPTFDENWQQMRRRGFEFRGAYHWIRSDSTMDAQVSNLRRAIDDHGGLRVGEFVMLDWETTPGIANVTVAQVNEWLRLAEQIWPGRIAVYASDWVPGFSSWRRSHPQYALVYANYNTGGSSRGGWAETEAWDADIWQWTSSATIAGFADPTVDMNHVRVWETLTRITAQTEEQDMPKEYIVPAPAERPGGPWILKVNGVSSYATNGDDGYPTFPLPLEQYDLLVASVFGPKIQDVKVTNPTGGTGATSFTLTGDIIPTG